MNRVWGSAGVCAAIGVFGSVIVVPGIAHADGLVIIGSDCNHSQLNVVADATDEGRHSPFARSFIEALRTNDSVIDGTELFSQLRHPVMVNADQTPEYADIRRAGHDGGDFLFVRR